MSQAPAKPAHPKESPELADLRKQVRQDANELFELITIEVAAGNQMDQTERRLRELTKACKEEKARIRQFNRRLPREQERAARLQAAEKDNAANPPTQSDPPAEIRGRISELEKELKRLYTERARLITTRAH
jgi:chromosome segregation ATPase